MQLIVTITLCTYSAVAQQQPWLLRNCRVCSTIQRMRGINLHQPALIAEGMGGRGWGYFSKVCCTHIHKTGVKRIHKNNDKVCIGIYFVHERARCLVTRLVTQVPMEQPNEKAAKQISGYSVPNKRRCPSQDIRCRAYTG